MTAPVSVVLATHNRRDTLALSLAALEAQKGPSFRVVVVDDGSQDGTWQWLRSFEADSSRMSLTAIRQEHGGQGEARNRGLREVEDGLVVFIGDDIIPEPGFLAEHRAAHQHLQGSWAVVGFTDWCRSRMRVTPVLEMVNREGHQFGYGHMQGGEEVPFTCFYTSNLSVPRQLLGEDPFAPQFRCYGWEDVELGYRLSKRGVRLTYHPAARAEHLHPMSLGTLVARQRLVGRGLHTLLELHLELRDSPLLTSMWPPWWFPAGRALMPLAVPAADRLDRLGVPLATGLLHRILICAFHQGVRSGLSRS